MLKVAVIGAGTMGKTHAAAYAEMPNAELVGIVDMRLAAATSAAHQYGTRPFDALATMVAETKPDVIDVCVPTYEHRHYVEQAAAQVKHVICEKPIARQLDDAAAMMEACKRAGATLYIAQVVRFFPEFRRAKELVDGGTIGPVGTVRSMRGGVFPTGWNDWYASAEKSGTAAVDLIVHDFDFLRWCFGDVERVFAKSLWGRELNRVDHVLVSLRFKNGVIAHVEGNWAYPGGFRTELEIAGRDGIISHNSDTTMPIRTVYKQHSGVTGGVAVPESPTVHNPYYLELEHFLSCIEQGTTPIVTAYDGYKALEIGLAALESIRTGQPVTLNAGGGF